MIAIFGGSFDPVHFGHLENAKKVQKLFNFEKFIFLPCGEPPHKDKLLFSQTQRLKMLNLAIENNQNFEISDFEFNGKISYTIDTLKYFKKKYGKICFVLGADSFADLPTWEGFAEFADLTNILVLSRNSKNLQINTYNFTKTTKIVEFKQKPAQVYFMQNDLIDISSTAIRSKISHKDDLGKFLPQTIIKYIDEHTTITTN